MYMHTNFSLLENTKNKKFNMCIINTKMMYMYMYLHRKWIISVTCERVSSVTLAHPVHSHMSDRQGQFEYHQVCDACSWPTNTRRTSVRSLTGCLQWQDYVTCTRSPRQPGIPIPM